MTQLNPPPLFLKTLLAIVAISALGSCASLRPRGEICDGQVVFLENREFVVNENADKLICGDPDYPSWREIPPNQQQLMLQGILTKAGFHRPSFKVENGTLKVNPGARSRIRRVQFLNVPDEFFDYRPARFEGRPITTDTIEEIEIWATRRIHEIAYPCGEVRVLASVEDETVLVQLTPGKKRLFPGDLRHSQSEMNPAVELRYRAFTKGQPYQYSLTKLSSQRMELSGVSTRSMYEPLCEESTRSDQIPIAHRVSLGPSRAIQIGFGFSSEEYFLTRASWRNHRVGPRASLLGATLRASFIEQQATFFTNYYPTNEFPRFYLAPKFDVRHAKERNQEYNRATIPLMAGWSTELTHGQLRLEAGPSLLYERVLEGPILGDKGLVLGDTQWIYQSHLYETYQIRPREGFEMSFNTSSVLLSLQDRPNAHRTQLRGTWLWNLGKYDPARYVLGLRTKLHSLLRQPRDTDLARVPIEYFTWLGGEDDLRGFGRRELPFNRNGALTSAYLGTEFRAPIYFGETLDPLIFFDIGMLGTDRNFGLEAPLYYAPGFGVRYQSPVGAIRTTFAHGFISGSDAETEKYEHFQFFLSLGKEF